MPGFRHPETGYAVAKLFKAFEASQNAVEDTCPEDLEAFPLKDIPVFAIPGDMNAQEEEPELEPEALREMILAEAKEEARLKVEAAYEEGMQRGIAAGREDYESRVGQSAEALLVAAEAMRQARSDFLESLEPQVVELATLIAARVLDREIRTDPELIHSTVKRALIKIADRQRLRVRVSPQDLAALQKHMVTLLEDFDGVEELELVEDETIESGGCVVDSELMQVDARIETLLANVLDEMAG